MARHWRQRLALGLLGLALVAGPVACGSAGPPPLPKVGEWAWGRSLAIRVEKWEPSPRLVYWQGDKYWQLQSPAGQQFVMVWLDIYQNEAGTMQLAPASDRVELRDAQGNKYTPAPISGGEAIESPPQGYYTPLFTEPVSLPPGNQISGWVAFLMPGDVSPQELVWDDIDRITIKL